MSPKQVQQVTMFHVCGNMFDCAVVDGLWCWFCIGDMHSTSGDMERGGNYVTILGGVCNGFYKKFKLY